MNGELPSKQKFDAYVKLGLIDAQSHPNLPLTIYRYSRFADYEGLWNGPTIAARGLVLDDRGRCVVRCLPKFFNASEVYSVFNKKEGEPTYYEKLDGSLIQIVNDPEYGFIVTSKASFTSRQALWAMDIFNEAGYSKSSLKPDRTYIFELIHPDNRIVLDYGKEKSLRLLAITDNTTGVEYSIKGTDFDYVDEIKDINEYLSRTDVEGLVAKIGRYRYKIKTDEYVRLHRIVTNFTPKRVWEALSQSESLEFYNMPEEFSQWLSDTIADLKLKYKTIDIQIKNEYNQSIEWTDKELAQSALQWKSAIFLKRKSGNYEKFIWKQIKPKG